MNFGFLQRTNGELRLDGRAIVSDIRWATVLSVAIEQRLLLPAEARKACGKFEAGNTSDAKPGWNWIKDQQPMEPFATKGTLVRAATAEGDSLC